MCVCSIIKRKEEKILLAIFMTYRVYVRKLMKNCIVCRCDDEYRDVTIQDIYLDDNTILISEGEM